MIRRGGDYLSRLGLIVLFLVVFLATVEAQTPGSGVAPAPTPTTAPSPEGSEGDYVVKKGDTLWGIARSLLNDPLLWPQLWERNRFITNPNRIFPGDTLAIPGREAAPPAAQVEAPRPEPPKEAPKEQAQAPAPSPPAPRAAPEIIVTPLPPVPPASQMAIACSPVLLQEAVADTAGIGSIIRTRDNAVLVSQEDYVDIGLDKDQIPKVGDRLAVIRAGDRVFHPWQKNILGRALLTLGIIEVMEIRDKTVRARITYSCEAMSGGNRVGPLILTPFPVDKIAQPTSRQVEGFIVDSPRWFPYVGLQNAVYLDVGGVQGISPGDVFAIYRPVAPAADLQTGKLFPIPPERLGEATVIRVTNTSSTAVITASQKEIHVGDQVVLSRQIQP
jgi:hypothetical protein